MMSLTDTRCLYVQVMSSMPPFSSSPDLSGTLWRAFLHVKRLNDMQSHAPPGLIFMSSHALWIHDSYRPTTRRNGIPSRPCFPARTIEPVFDSECFSRGFTRNLERHTRACKVERPRPATTIVSCLSACYDLVRQY